MSAENPAGVVMGGMFLTAATFDFWNHHADKYPDLWPLPYAASAIIAAFVVYLLTRPKSTS